MFTKTPGYVGGCGQKKRGLASALQLRFFHDSREVMRHKVSFVRHRVTVIPGEESYGVGWSVGGRKAAGVLPVARLTARSRERRSWYPTRSIAPRIEQMPLAMTFTAHAAR